MSKKHRWHAHAGLALKIAVVLLAFGLVADRADVYRSAAFIEGDAGANLLIVVGVWLGALGPGFLLVALWFLGGSFDALRHGKPFGDTMAKCLSRTGVNLLLGAVAAGVVLPAFLQFADVGVAIAAPVGVSLFAIGLIGGAFMLLARLGLQMRGELEGFV